MKCEKEMKEKNKMGEKGCMCVMGEKKKERQGVHGGGEKKRKKKKWGVGFTCMVGKKGEWKRKKKKKFEKVKN